MRYSIFSLLRQALAKHRGWAPAWRDAAPKAGYDVIVVGGGGHGLAKEQDLNYNTMVSQRGVLNLYHSDAQRDAYARRGGTGIIPAPHSIDQRARQAPQFRAGKDSATARRLDTAAAV